MATEKNLFYWGTMSDPVSSTPNRKVLIVGEFGILNGGEKSFLAIASSLIKLGWELTAAVPYDLKPADPMLTANLIDTNPERARVSYDPEITEFAQALESKGIRVFDWNVRENGKRKELSVIREELSSLISRVKPAIVHFNSLSTSRIGGPVVEELGIPSLGYLRDIMGLSKAAIRDINRVDRIIAVSKATKDWHVGNGLLPDKTFVVYNGVDSNEFSPSKKSDSSTLGGDEISKPGIREELSIADDDQILLFVGQIGIRKGVDTLVEAFLELAKTNHKIQLLIVGQRHAQKQEAIEYETRIIQSVAASPHSNRVHLLGRRDDVSNIMRETDILVHPARQEPLGRVLLEASSSGIVIVTTDVGGSAEIICKDPDSNYLSGLLLPPDDATALMIRLNELLSDTEQMQKIGAELRARATSKFSVKNCVMQIHQHYRLLLGSLAGN